jgi:hypothetical protein
MAQRLIILLSMLLSWPMAAQNPSSLGASRVDSGMFRVTDFGADGGGARDCTGAFQAAIHEASKRGGSVFVPPGRFLCKGHLLLEPGVHLVGVNSAPQSWEPQSGSILLPTEGRDAEDGPAFIEMRSSTSLDGVTIYYPEQTTDNIRPYPWTIQIRGDPADPRAVSFDSTVENVTLINSYDGIRTGPTENGRHRLININGCVLRRGIMVDWTGDVGRIENVQFHSHFWANKAFEGNWDRVFKFMQENLEAFVFGRTDWEYVNNTFVFPAKVGYRFIETTNGACNGQFNGIGADATATCLLAQSLQPQGIAIVNGEFNSHRVGAATQIVVEKTCRGNIRFLNCGFWGPVEQNAMLAGPSFVSFDNCYFSNDYDTTNYSILAKDGKVQITGCTFDARSKRRRSGNAWNEDDLRNQPGCIRLMPGVQHAIVTGNNGYYGVSVKNEIGTNAIIRDNEPFEGKPQPSLK